MAQTKTKIIKVIVQTSDRALRSMSRRFDRLNKSVKKLSGSFSHIRNVFLGMFAAVGLRSIVRTMDTFQLMQDRMKIFTGSAELARAAFYELAQGARFVKSSIASLGDAYNKIAVATSDLGFNSKQVLSIVVALQQTLRLSGAAAQEAASVFLQFGQALSLGRIQGQELRALMLGNAKFTQLLADKMNVAKGVLKQMGEQGKLTNEKVLTALLGNFQALNDEASFLNQTFEQTFIITLDAVKIKLKELNEEFKLSVRFAAVAKFFLENFSDIMVAVGATIGGVVVAFGAFNPAIAIAATAIAGVGVAAFYASKNIKQIELSILELQEATAKSAGGLTGWKKTVLEALTSGHIFSNTVKLFSQRLYLSIENMKRTGKVSKETADRMEELRRQIKLTSKNPGGNLKKFMEGLAEQARKTVKALLEGRSGKGVVGAFYELNKQFKDGNIVKYAQALRTIQIGELNQKVESGKVTLVDYRKELEKINEEFRKIARGEGFFAGIELGARKTAESIGTLANQISGVVGNAFNSLEDRLFDFVKKGKFEFRKFAQAILDDLTRVIIRMSIIRPLATAATSVFTPTAGPYDLSNTTTAPHQATVAKGGVFSGGNILPFAKGGVVNSPTLFPMANGAGLMGEAGPEAVMPLARDSQGRLGVRGGGTVVNVYNNSSNTEAQTSERTGPNGEKQIDVLIVNKVSSAIGEGRMDKVFKQVYGLNRRGA